MTKPFDIPKSLIYEAYKRVKANKGSAGVDRQSLEELEVNLKDNLYKLWNRMSSGSYYPPPVKGVSIPKKTGGVRLLGVPTVLDRIAQMVVKLRFEKKVEPHFLENSYGYRPGKSATDAIGITRQRCWQYDWVLEFDIRKLFDEIPHELLLKAVDKHTEERWERLYIQRWLVVPILLEDGTLSPRDKGTPQGGVISPVLSNLFLHYAFDVWITQHYPHHLWCRYADDGIVHCQTEAQAQELLINLRKRFQECGLELHSEKTRIVYCKDDNRKQDYPVTSFEFLGFLFTKRVSRNKRTGSIFQSFQPAASPVSVKAMVSRLRDGKWSRRSDLSLEDIAIQINPVLRGWFNYYGSYYSSQLNPVWRYWNCTLVRWARRKYKKLRRHLARAIRFLYGISKREPGLFVPWTIGNSNSFD